MRSVPFFPEAQGLDMFRCLSSFVVDNVSVFLVLFTQVFGCPTRYPSCDPPTPNLVGGLYYVGSGLGSWTLTFE